MSALLSIPTPLQSHLLQSHLGWRHHLTPDTLPSGIENLDFPRGRISEVAGRASSGRTTLRNQLLAQATGRAEYCAVVDAMNTFDPATAEQAGVALDHVVWVQCGGNLEHVMKAADLLLHSGGFGVVVLDLCDVPEGNLRRIPASYWFRFRRTVETGQTVLLVMAERALTHSCSTLLVEMERPEVEFRGSLLRGLRCRAVPRKPVCSRPVAWPVAAGM